MITFFGGASLVILALCVAGLVLHHRVMKKRWRVDAALELLDEMGFADDIDDESEKQFSPEDKTAAIHEYEAAQADYVAYVSRFPGNIIKSILLLP